MKNLILIITILSAGLANAHKTEVVDSQPGMLQSGEVTYLANSGLMVSHGEQQILSERINAVYNTGIHVPVVVPIKLQNSGEDFFLNQRKSSK